MSSFVHAIRPQETHTHTGREYEGGVECTHQPPRHAYANTYIYTYMYMYGCIECVRAFEEGGMERKEIHSPGHAGDQGLQTGNDSHLQKRKKSRVNEEAGDRSLRCPTGLEPL